MRSPLRLVIATLLAAGCGPAALLVGSRDAGAPDVAAPTVEAGPDRVDTPDASVETAAPDAPPAGCLVEIDPLHTNVYPVVVASGDLDGDGKIDLVIGHSLGSSHVYLGHGDGTFSETNSALNANPPLALGDLNGDGKLDVVIVSNISSNVVRVFLGDGTGGFQAPLDRTMGGYAQALAIADFDRNGHPDLAVATAVTTSPASVLVLPGRGDGTFGTEVATGVGDANPEHDTLLAADLDGNGDTDLAFCCGSNTIPVLLGAGNGTLGPVAMFATGPDSQPMAIAVGDLDGDGKPDIAVADGTTVGVGVLRGRGDGTFESVVQYASAVNNGQIAIADMDGDGRLDVVYTLTAGGVGVLFGNSEGGLRAPAVFSASIGQPTSIALVDVTGDQKPDVLVADLSPPAVRILRNDCGR